MGAPVAWAGGYTGAGQSIAIIDSGVQNNHPFLERASRRGGLLLRQEHLGDPNVFGLCTGGDPGGNQYHTEGANAAPAMRRHQRM